MHQHLGAYAGGASRANAGDYSVRSYSQCARASLLTNNSAFAATRMMGVLLGLVVFIAEPRLGWSQAAAQPLTSEPIPKGDYKSWSLFLICNPGWLLPQSKPQVEELYQRFEAFGAAIGPEHLAVWFWSPEAGGTGTTRSVDFDRSSRFCARLKLAPSKGPYVILTTRYPGTALPTGYPNTFPSIANLGNHYILALGGASASDTARLLDSLADQLITSDVSKVQLDSDEYWRAWERTYRTVRDQLVGLFDKVTVTFDTGVVKTEIKF